MRLGVDHETGLRMLFVRLAAMIEEGNVSFLGPEWTSAVQKVKAENHGVIATGAILDIDKLHRSDKTKSGFVGVYASGTKWRADGQVPNSTRQRHLGVWNSPEEAAWWRRDYYKKNNIPYGPMELEIANLRRKGYKGTDAELEANMRAYDESIGYKTVEPGEEDRDYDPQDPHGDRDHDRSLEDPDYKAAHDALQAKIKAGKKVNGDDVPMAGFVNGVPADIEVALRRADK